MTFGDPEWIFENDENDENDERGEAIENVFAFLFSFCYFAYPLRGEYSPQGNPRDVSHGARKSLHGVDVKKTMVCTWSCNFDAS